MITSRRITENDRAGVELALAHDTWHPNATADMAYAANTFTSIYEDEGRPVMLIRVSVQRENPKLLRIDVLFYRNNDRARNVAAMLYAIGPLVSSAKLGEFQEIGTSTFNSALADFVCAHLGFEKTGTVAGEVFLRRTL